MLLIGAGPLSAMKRRRIGAHRSFVFTDIGEDRIVEDENYFREKAAQYRRLAETFHIRDDPAAAKLLALAAEIEAKAVAIAAELASSASE